MHPAGPVDTDMHPIIACPMTHLCVKTVVHTLTDPLLATIGQCLCAFQGIPCSPLSIFGPPNRLSWPTWGAKSSTKSCARLQTSRTANRELQKRQQVG